MWILVFLTRSFAPSLSSYNFLFLFYTCKRMTTCFAQDLTFATRTRNFAHVIHTCHACANFPLRARRDDATCSFLLAQIPRGFFFVFFLTDRSTTRSRNDAAGKIERASPVNTINQLNPRVGKRRGCRGLVCMRVRVNVG